MELLVGILFLIFILIIFFKFYHRIPSKIEVDKTISDIQYTFNIGQRSFKSDLIFFFPNHWKFTKLSKAGYAIRPKGLGAPVVFYLFATDVDPQFNDLSMAGMLSNVKDLREKNGFKIDEKSVQHYSIAGIGGIKYYYSKNNKMNNIGYFFSYAGGDYELLVETKTKKHLDVISPATDLFVNLFRLK